MKIINLSSEFNGFDDWVEIFTGGRQTDSEGVEHNGDDLVDAAVSSFDPSYHEPPVVLGHPAHDAPAYGWVSELKTGTKNGAKRLYAKFKQVVPEFEEMVKAGRYKKRSASFYPDGRLRHVGWLGAMPPAVKALADVAFKEDDKAINFEFTETETPTKKETKMNFKEFMEGVKLWAKIQDDTDPETGDFTLPTNTTGNRKPAASFTEDDVEAAKTEAAKLAHEEGKKAAQAEFAEAEQKRKAAETKDKIKTIIETGTEKGTIAPAWKDAGISEFMENLDAEKPIAFAEGKDKKTGLDWFVDFLGSLPKLIDFSEIATRDKDVKTGDAAAKLEALVRDRMNENKDLTYGAAFCEVQQEHPGLAGEYQQELNS